MTTVTLSYEDAAALRNLLTVINDEDECRRSFGRSVGLKPRQMVALEQRVTKACHAHLLITNIEKGSKKS